MDVAILLTYAACPSYISPTGHFHFLVPNVLRQVVRGPTLFRFGPIYLHRQLEVTDFSGTAAHWNNLSATREPQNSPVLNLSLAVEFPLYEK